MFRFLWRYLVEKKSPVIHKFTRIMLAMNVAPFEVQYVVRHNAEKHQAKYPLAAETVLKSTYIDDTMDSTETEDNGDILYGNICMGIFKKYVRSRFPSFDPPPPPPSFSLIPLVCFRALSTAKVRSFCLELTLSPSISIHVKCREKKLIMSTSIFG